MRLISVPPCCRQPLPSPTLPSCHLPHPPSLHIAAYRCISFSSVLRSSEQCISPSLSLLKGQSSTWPSKQITVGGESKIVTIHPRPAGPSRSWPKSVFQFVQTFLLPAVQCPVPQITWQSQMQPVGACSLYTAREELAHFRGKCKGFGECNFEERARGRAGTVTCSLLQKKILISDTKATHAST